MALYYPQPNQKRPLILVGPPSIGRHELRQRLLDDTVKFAAPIPRKLTLSYNPLLLLVANSNSIKIPIYNERLSNLVLFTDTSRPKEGGEIDGSDYHFISRSQFESQASGGRFLEHGEYDKQYYGTSLER